MNNFRTRPITSILIGTVFLSIVLTLVGCNTVEGVGKDVEDAGEGLQGAAERNK